MLSNDAAPLSDAQVDGAAAVLVRAFAGDPGLLHVLPDPVDRQRLSGALALAGVRFTQRCGKPLVDAGTPRGVALWFPPDAKPPSQSDLVETGIAAVPGLLGPDAWQRLKAILDHIDELHRSAMPDPHWYLTVLGVDPEWQRQGIGETLMRPVFKAAYRDGLGCYLEAPTEANARYYERRGFAVIGETDIPDSNIHLWQMLRAPQP